MAASKSLHHALVLPGAVARGAFEAGVIDVMSKKNIRIDRIVATSSGALNGIVYAAAIRAGLESTLIPQLLKAWLKLGSWEQSLSFSPWDLVRGRGLSDGSGLIKLMRSLVKPFPNSLKREVQLRIIVSPLRGVVGEIGGEPATTYEHVLHFANEDFDTQESLEEIFKVVTAACAFPGVFVPVELEGLGPCVDGGAVNNAPIGYALTEADVERIFVVVPFPALMEAPKSLSGLGLATHIAEMLINERLYRDMNQAEVRNRKAESLKDLFAKNAVPTHEEKEILKVIGLRRVDIVPIRPRQAIKPSAFSGFFYKSDRKSLIESGRQAALEQLA